jgi:hypothetical protein
MKTHSHLWEIIVSDENLMEAHKNAKKGKGWYEEVLMVERDIHSDPNKPMGKLIPKLQRKLKNHTHHTSKYTTQQRREGKKIRDLYKLPYYPDRIAQWAVIQVIEPILIRNLITDTYSAIPRRGIHAGLKRLHHWIRTDVFGTQFCLKVDARHFYQSINHEILKDKFRRLFKDPDLLWFMDEVIDSVDTATQEDRERLSKVLPPSDWLLKRYIRGRHETPEEREKRYLESGIGLPIGNYFSQYGGNFYFNEFDHWIKEVKHVKYYMRYMDDIVILMDSKEKLHELRKEIEVYFETNMRITMKDNWQVFPTLTRGLDYLGYRTFLGYTLLRRTTCQSFKRKMNRLKKKADSGKEFTLSDFCCVFSYIGWLKSCDSFRLYQKYIEPLKSALQAYFTKANQERMILSG